MLDGMLTKSNAQLGEASRPFQTGIGGGKALIDESTVRSTRAWSTADVSRLWEPLTGGGDAHAAAPESARDRSWTGRSRVLAGIELWKSGRSGCDPAPPPLPRFRDQFRPSSASPDSAAVEPPDHLSIS
jgi:hypothetical protein